MTPDSNPDDQIADFAELLVAARHIVCLTGAGMSTESGIPDFRSSAGLYQTGTSEELFDIRFFDRASDQFYSAIGPFWQALLEASPNPGHRALAELERRGKKVSIATQNIDGLHQKAGSTCVYEIHGTMRTLTCRKCGQQVSGLSYEGALAQGQTLRHPCGGVLKPDITFFGENLPEEAFERSAAAMRQGDIILILGTSLQVYPAAALPDYRGREIPLVLVNRTPTPLDSAATLVFHDSIGDILGQVLPLIPH